MFEAGIKGGTVTRSEFFFPSSLAGERIHALKWEPSETCPGAPLGVVQLIHGMEEHIARYDDFARFLAMRGFVVCGASHIAHGKSASSEERLSCLPENGAQVMLSDVRTLHSMLAAEYPDVPYFMFGHSMGSFVLRVYLAQYGCDLDGAIVCGTGQQPRAAVLCGNWVARRIGNSKGFDFRSDFLSDLIVGSFKKAIPNARTSFDWLSTDPSAVDAYIADPACGVMFSAGGYASLTDIIAQATKNSVAAAVPEGLPVLFIAGSEDPVGACGKGPQAAAEAMQRRSGACVSLIMYEGMRHEILNEPDRLSVYFDVLDFLQSACREVRR